MYGACIHMYMRVYYAQVCTWGMHIGVHGQGTGVYYKGVLGMGIEGYLGGERVSACMCMCVVTNNKYNNVVNT